MAIALKQRSFLWHQNGARWLCNLCCCSLVSGGSEPECVCASYVRFGTKTIARLKGVDDEPAEVAYLHQDHLGSPVAATDETGAVLWRESYTPFGESLNDPVANRDNENFTGHIRDANTGLIYMQARYMDPVVGRFLSNDPVGFAEGGVDYFNRYSYTANNPVNAIDPDGRDIEQVDGDIGDLAKKTAEVVLEGGSDADMVCSLQSGPEFEVSLAMSRHRPFLDCAVSDFNQFDPHQTHRIVGAIWSGYACLIGHSNASVDLTTSNTF